MTLTEKPWGYEEILEQNEFYVLKHIHIHHGQRTSLHYHREKVETLRVIEGTVLVKVGPRHFHITSKDDAGARIHVEPGVQHRFTAVIEGCVDLWEVSSPHLEDVVRVEDDYGRKG
jgi:mannose-6-phosphate isomerase-like protein (cupin superfamily)